jgi:hypothetical protein
MSELCHFGDSLGFGLYFAGALIRVVLVMLMHLSLVLMKIEFVNSLRPDLKRIYVSCLTFH